MFPQQPLYSHISFIFSMINMKRILAFWLVMVLLMSGLVGFANIRGETGSTNYVKEYCKCPNNALSISYQEKSYTPHDPISIYGNLAFASQAENESWAGNGTEGNPYIIENWDINASGANGIDIKADVYFIIRNCIVHDGKNNYGIYFYSVQHGRIENCKIYNNSEYGIVLDSSSNNQITDCDIYNNYFGIYLHYSSNNNITNCDVYNHFLGIYLHYSSNNNNISVCNVYNNSRGIMFYISSSNQIHYCNIYNNTNYGVERHEGSTLDVTNCWWGSADGPSGVGPGSGDKVSSGVLYDPWWTIQAYFGVAMSIPNAYNYVNVNQAVEINSSSSYTDDGTITQYFFDFGDGNNTGWIESEIIDHSYTAPGQYNITLKVKNDLGWISNWSEGTQITVFTNIPPFADLQVSSGQTYTNLTFSGYSSWDIDGNITEYFFDFDDENDTGWVSTSNITRQYTDNGVHTVRLNVKDNEGSESDWTDNITFYVYNRPPVAVLSANPVVVEIGSPITFSGLDSYDLDGNVTEYYFDFGDGENTGWISDFSKSHLYTTSGVYTVTLKVKDDDGAIGTAYVEVTVCQPVQTITPSGGTVIYINITIIVPEGAITQNVTFTITKISTANPSGYIIIGEVCSIETDVTTFAQPMTLILSYNESNLPAGVGEDDLAIYKKVGDSWVKLDSTVDKINNTISTVVTGFSDYAILYEKPSAGGKTSEIPWLYIIIPVIIIIALIGAGFGIKKKTAGKTKKNTMEIRCPSCKTMFEVEEQERPFKVKCPKCGKEGTIK